MESLISKVVVPIPKMTAIIGKQEAREAFNGKSAGWEQLV
jgi:hypothetical protein